MVIPKSSISPASKAFSCVASFSFADIAENQGYDEDDDEEEHDEDVVIVFIVVVDVVVVVFIFVVVL